MDLNVAGPLRKFQLNKLDELRRDTYKNACIFKAKMEAVHDQHILCHVFNPSDKMLLYDP